MNSPSENRIRLSVIVGMVLLAAAFRVLPHPSNFSPVAAMALFGGVHFANRRLAFAVPLVAMFLSDLILGLHSMMPIIYGCFAMIVVLGIRVRRKPTVFRVAGSALAGSVGFFLVTNFAVWALSSMYPKTAAGLSSCYVAAIPFFWRTAAGDLFYVATLFGSFRLAEWKIPALRETSTQPAFT